MDMEGTLGHKSGESSQSCFTPDYGSLHQVSMCGACYQSDSSIRMDVLLCLFSYICDGMDRQGLVIGQKWCLNCMALHKMEVVIMIHQAFEYYFISSDIAVTIYRRYVLHIY